jgi:hypothetical protein
MAVERSRWTDDRLDDLAERVVRQDALSEKVDDVGRVLAKQIADLRNDLGGQINDMRRELYNTRWTVVGIWLGLAAIFVEIAIRT